MCVLALPFVFVSVFVFVVVFVFVLVVVVAGVVVIVVALWVGWWAVTCACTRGHAGGEQGHAKRGGSGGAILWMDEILHHFESWLKPLLVGIYRGIIIPGFVMWCRILSIHIFSSTFAG